MNAETLMLLAGAGAFALTVYWVRGRELSERYALGWLVAATLVLLCGLFPGALEWAAGAARLSYPAAVLFVALTAGYLFAFSVSVALTRVHRRGVRLVQAVALLEQRVRELEAAAGRTNGPGGAAR